MDLDDRDCWKCECPSLCYYDGTSVVYKPNMLEYSFGFTTRINDCNHRLHWRDICLLEEYLSERKVSGFEDVSRKNWFEIIYESEARYLINEEFEYPYSLLTYTTVWESMNLDELQPVRYYPIYKSDINEEFEDPYSWIISINESEAGHLLNEEFEDPYTRFIYCNHSYHFIDVYLLKACLSERKVSGFEDVSRKTWFDTINESEAGHLINEEFEDPYTRFICK
ncbi:uncharacterized protein LOC143081017 [Mytilus galloprovincialis]|uniref:uncharacterized protein LOC143081017 n=1 Tax=Mytilus galloprovincialis TaxID=29158 RepID=UPI003F7B6694